MSARRDRSKRIRRKRSEAPIRHRSKWNGLTIRYGDVPLQITRRGGGNNKEKRKHTMNWKKGKKPERKRKKREKEEDGKKRATQKSRRQLLAT